MKSANSVMKIQDIKIVSVSQKTIAPEHAELLVEKYEDFLPLLTNAAHIIELAEAEGMHAHALAVKVRE